MMLAAATVECESGNMEIYERRPSLRGQIHERSLSGQGLQETTDTTDTTDRQ